MFFVLSLIIGQANRNEDAPVPGKALPLTTQPISIVSGIKRRAIVSVMEYKSKPSVLTTRVYRYVYRGEYESTVQMFRRTLTKKDGWRVSPVGAFETDFWRTSQTGLLAQQGVIVQATRLVKDRTSPTGWSPLPPNQGKGWLWISYNEQFRPLR
jgi:hypothetical protein